MQAPYLLIGEIVRPHGVRGEVKVRPYTDDPARFSQLNTLYFQAASGYEPVEVLAARVAGQDVYLRLPGVDTREAAEALRGRMLYIDRAHAAPLGEDETYICDLIGLRAEDEAGAPIGELCDVLTPGGVDVYVFRTATGSLMMPALKRVIRRVDLEAGVMVLCASALEEVAVVEDRDPDALS